jgi:predicted RNA-binding Zn-ribbon protein involved in translation (DUF1610 family)
MTPRGTEVLPVEQNTKPHKRHPHQRVCPECGEEKVRRSRRRTLLDYLLSLSGLRPYRCRECNQRFYDYSRSRRLPREPRSRWAKCPRCGGTSAYRIARNKVPSTWGNLLWRILPVSGFRCPECRKRFFDYRPQRPKEDRPS